MFCNLQGDTNDKIISGDICQLTTNSGILSGRRDTNSKECPQTDFCISMTTEYTKNSKGFIDDDEMDDNFDAAYFPGFSTLNIHNFRSGT
jgi:hypothetical protein